MTEEKLLDELNDLCENTLCPMDLMDSIDEFVRIKIVEELEILTYTTPKCDVGGKISLRIKELKHDW